MSARKQKEKAYKRQLRSSAASELKSGTGKTAGSQLTAKVNNASLTGEHHCRGGHTDHAFDIARCLNLKHEGFCPVCFVRFNYNGGCNLHNFNKEDLIYEIVELEIQEERLAYHQSLGLIGPTATVKKNMQYLVLSVVNGELIVDRDLRAERAAGVPPDQGISDARDQRGRQNVVQQYNRNAVDDQDQVNAAENDVVDAQRVEAVAAGAAVQQQTVPGTKKPGLKRNKLVATEPARFKAPKQGTL